LEADGASAVVVLRDQLLADAQRHADGSCQALLQLAGGRTELRLSSCPELREGWQVRASGVLQRPPLAPHPLLAGPAERLARQGCWTRLRVERLEVLARPATPVADLRRRIAERFLTWAGPERGGLLAALVLGSAVGPLPQALSEAFRVSGLSHALAASGFHLTVLLGAVLVLARLFGRAGRLLLASGAILLFLLLAGPQPSVVRAVLMGALALGAREAGLRGHPLGLLALSAAGMLLLRPVWLQDVGFQLSVAATAGLVVSADPLEGSLRPPLEAIPLLPPAWRPRLAALLAPALAVPLAASLWTLPLQLLHFGVVPLWAVPANVLATPLLTPLTLGATGAAVVGLVAPPLQALAMPPLSWLAQGLLAVAQGAAALPMAQWHSGRLPFWLVMLFSLGLLGWVLPRSRGLRGWALALLVLACALHLHQLRADAVVLVQDGPRTLLLARHRGRRSKESRGYGPDAAVAGPELQRLPHRRSFIPQGDGGLELFSQRRIAEPAPFPGSDAAVQLAQLPEGALAQFTGLALLDHREIAIGDHHRRLADRLGPAAGGVLGPAIATPPVQQHPAERQPAGLLPCQQLVVTRAGAHRSLRVGGGGRHRGGVALPGCWRHGPQ
jgi:competence protein ComEC